MALEIKLTAGTVAAKGASVVFTDGTGSYNSVTNPTGYGSENELESPGDTGLAYILWRYWGSTSVKLTKLSLENISKLQDTGLTMTPYLAGVSTSETDVFSDGVHQIKLLPAQEVNGDDSNSTTVTLTPGSKIATLANADRVEDIVTSGGAKWLIINEETALEIDSSADNDNEELTLVSTYTGEALTVDLVLAAEGDEKILVTAKALSCIVYSIGKLADKTDSCRREEMEINKLIRWSFAGNVQFDCEDYEGAHNLILAIGKICDSGKCICNL